MEEIDIKAAEEKCASLLKKFRTRFYAMKRSPWYRDLRHLLEKGDEPPFDKDVLDVVETDEGFASLLELLPHIELPDGARLDCHIGGSPMGGNSEFFIKLENGERCDIRDWPVDPMSPEAIFERELLTWAGSQFYYWWHGGYSQCILLTEGKSVAGEARTHCSFSEDIFRDAPPEEKARIEAMDFSPRVYVRDGAAEVEFYIFSPWGGIIRQYTPRRPKEEEDDGVEIGDDENRIMPYDCGVCY